MGRGVVVFCGLILSMSVIGCTGVRAYKVTRDRVDVEVSGNQGVIYGPTPAPHTVANPTRDILAVDIELPTGGEVKAALKKEETDEDTAAQTEGAQGSAGAVSQGAEKIK